jgi:hypothetical protein
LNIIETLIILGIFSVIGSITKKNGPQTYYYENRIVAVYDKYQCPKYCEVDHHHYVYYDSTLSGMYIDKSKLGKKYDQKVEKIKRK